FRITEADKLAKLQAGQTVTIRGRCEGRSFRVVRLHDCALPPNEGAPPPGILRVPAERFFAAYEVDLLPFDRPNPNTPPVRVTADQIAMNYAADPITANATYRYKIVEVTGKVLARHPATRTVFLETGTTQKYQVAATFMSAKYAAVKDHPEL